MLGVEGDISHPLNFHKNKIISTVFPRRENTKGHPPASLHSYPPALFSAGKDEWLGHWQTWGETRSLPSSFGAFLSGDPSAFRQGPSLLNAPCPGAPPQGLVWLPNYQRLVGKSVSLRVREIGNLLSSTSCITNKDNILTSLWLFGHYFQTGCTCRRGRKGFSLFPKTPVLHLWHDLVKHSSTSKKFSIFLATTNSIIKKILQIYPHVLVILYL